MKQFLKKLNILLLMCLSTALSAHPHESIFDEITHHAYSLMSLDNALIFFSLLALALLTFSRES